MFAHGSVKTKRPSCEHRKMLKIFLFEAPTHCRVVLEGRMVGTGMKKLMTICAGPKSELKGRKLIIDMKDVMLISQEGEKALLQLINYGAKIRPRRRPSEMYSATTRWLQ